MTLDDALNEMTTLIRSVSPEAVLRTTRRGSDELAIRAYVPAEDEDAIREATRPRSIELLTSEGLDVQILTYDITTSLPPEE